MYFTYILNLYFCDYQVIKNAVRGKRTHREEMYSRERSRKRRVAGKKLTSTLNKKMETFFVIHVYLTQRRLKRMPGF